MRLRLKHLQRFTDRHGGVRCYFRKPGHKRLPLPPPGTSGFLEAYEAALANDPAPVGAKRTKAGSMAALATAYLNSPGFGQTGTFLHTVVVWTLIAAFSATVLTLGPSLLLTICM